MFKYILATFLVVIAWVVWYVLRDHIPLWAPIVFTVFVATVLLAMFLYRRYKARKAAREIEKALNAQAEDHARSVRPEQQAEVRAMQQEVLRAIGSLKSSKLGRAGTDALYALPWYVIIGPPGAGKSTALQNSGLQFPYLNARGEGKVRGIGGTRNCDWWLTNEGVLLDTAGRYTTGEEDRDEWLSFLDLLRRNRPRKPLNGLIVAVNVDQVGYAADTEVEATARQIRARIDEVMGQLQMILPVYIFFTKCDLIQGFSEYFGDLRKTDRGQIWGFTVPLGQPTSAPGELFAQRFDEIAQVVEQRGLRRLGAERRIDTREQIYQFPQQFEGLKANLTEFVEVLLAPNVYQGSPLLRGVYFTSGTQEGRPIDRVTQAMQKAFGLPAPAVAPPPPVTEAKSYFLRDVFSHIIFPDQDIAATSPEERARQQRQRYAIAAGVLGAALLVSILPTYAYLVNRDLVRSTGVIADNIAAQVRNPAAVHLTPAELEPLRARLDELDYDEHHYSPSMHFGMYKAEALHRPVRDLYVTAMRRHVLDPLRLYDVSAMRSFATRYPADQPPADERGQYYNLLKLHLLTTAPREGDQPPLSTSMQGYVTRALVTEWAGRVPSQAVDTAAMQRNAAQFTKLLAEDPGLALPRDVPAVQAVRGVLNRTPQTDLALSQIVTAVDAMHFDIDLQRAINRVPDYMHHVRPTSDTSPNRVRGAFTRQGWDLYVRDHLRSTPEEMAGEAWVLGARPGEVPGDRLAHAIHDLRCAYFTQYISEWHLFLESLRVREPVDTREALLLLRWLTGGGTAPYPYLMRTVAENTHLSEPDAAAANAAGASLGDSLLRAGRNRVAAAGQTGQAVANAAQAGANAARTNQGQAAGDLNCRDRDDLADDEMLRGLTEFGVPPAPPATAPGQPAPPPAPPSPTALGDYQEQLAFVRDELGSFLDNPAAPPAPLQARLQGAHTLIAARINSALVGSRPVLENLLPPPIDFTVRRTLGAVAGSRSDRWCSAVVVPYERTLHSRYPFNVAGQDAALADMADFYRPTRGTLWAFYTEALAGDMPRSGEAYSFATSSARRTSQEHTAFDPVNFYTPDLLPFLNNSQDISTVLFPPGSNDPRVDFEVRIRATPTIAELTFSVDGQEIQYRNGPEEWHRFRWPGEGAVRGARLRARGLTNGGGAGNLDETIQQDGEWGLYRLFEAGTVRGAPEARIFSVTWRLRDQDIEVGVDVRPGRSENPFFGIPRQNNTGNRFLLPFRVDHVDTPLAIAPTGNPCSLAGVPNAPTAPEHHHHDHEHHHHHHDHAAG